MFKKLSIALAALLLINTTPVSLFHMGLYAETAHAAYLHAFYPSRVTYQESMQKYLDQLDSVSFAWSRLNYDESNSDISINTTEGLNGNESFYFPADYLNPVRYAKSKGKPIQLSIYSNASTAEKILTDDAAMKKLVELILEQATRNIAGKTTGATVEQAPASTSGAIIAPNQASAPESTATPAISATSPAPATPTPSVSPASPVSSAAPVNSASSVDTTTPATSSTDLSSVPSATPSAIIPPEEESLFFDGIVIDFEGLRNTSTDGSLKTFNGKPISQYFNKFLQVLQKQLKTVNKKLFVAVNPADYYNGYDYKAIATIADRVILMAHDYEPVKSLTKSEAAQYYEYDVLTPTKSTAPANDVKRAVTDIKNKLGSKELCKKVILQVAFDAAQWQFALEDVNQWDFLDPETSSTGDKSTPTYAMIKNRIDNTDGAATNIIRGYNNLLECPYMTYYNPTDKLFNILVYENARSMESKIKHASNAGLGGISLWALGNVPDYTDKSGISAGLNVWSKIMELINSKSFWTPQSKPTGKAVKFTDKKLEAVIRNVLDKPAGSLYEGDLLEINRLKLPANTTSKLSDLKYLKNLEFLDASANNITDLKPLSAFTNLKAIYLSRNKIKDLKPLAKLTNLEVLSLNGNNITDISPLSGLVKLKKLYLSENNITSVKPLVKLVNLRELYLIKDPVKDAGVLDSLRCSIEL